MCMASDHVSEFINVRDTAALLGVHENTVRSWAKQGLLTDARVPGSRFLRFNRSEVERLQDERGRPSASLAEERQTVGPELVNAAQLALWAGTRAAQGLFPELMRRLLSSTPGVTAIQIRSGDSVALPGWDGSAESVGTSYLPSGSLRIEFGVNAKVKAKADHDWGQRVADDPQPEVFVFATPRKWGGGPAWAKAKRAEKKFANVHVIDADTIEGWLQATPSVHYWISEKIGRSPEAARTIESWWERFSASTEPALPAPLFTAGRDDQVENLRQLLAGDPRTITIRSEWERDILGFIYGATKVAGTDLAPVVVVDDPVVFGRIADQPGRVTLVPAFADADIARAVQQGHHVILVTDETMASGRRPDLQLPRPARRQTVDAFQASEINFPQAQRYAAHARRNLQAFVRSLSKDDRFARPAWAEPPTADPIARLLLVGSWTTRPADLHEVEGFVGKSRGELADLLDQVSSVDPVFRKVGQQWTVTSPRETFDLLAPRIAARPTLLDDWLEFAYRVLSEADPVLDLPVNERPLAGMRDIRRKFSDVLRRGVARGAALLGALGDDFALDDGTTLSELPSRLVERLLSEANADQTARRWQELRDALPLLAEAAPEAFLRAVDEDLARDEPVLRGLFADSGPEADALFGSHSPHTYLLWALETLCWSPEYLNDSVRALGRLAALDPGGRLSNRPAATLGTVLSGWVRNTSATAEARLAAVRMLLVEQPDICWPLVLALWPSRHGFSMPPHYPYLQRWTPTAHTVLMSEWAAFTHEIVTIALELVKVQPRRIGELVDGLGTVPRDDQTAILAELDRITAHPESLGDDRIALWQQLQKLVGHHERYSTAQWAFDGKTPGAIRVALDRLEPPADPRRFAPLFDWHPEIPGLDDDDLDEYDKQLAALRQEALTSVLESTEPISALTELVRHVPATGHVGHALRAVDAITLSDLIPWLASDEEALRIAASTWVLQRASEDGSAAWVAQSLDSDDLTGDAREIFLRSLPIRRELWEIIERNQAEATTWWKSIYPRFVAPEDATIVVERLRSHGRAWVAVTVLAHALHQQVSTETAAMDFPADLIITTLDAAIAEDPVPSDISNMTSYDLGRLLDALAKVGVDDNTMARFEFAFYRVLEHTRPATVLHRVLANQPELFVDLGQRAFRGKQEPARDLDQSEQGLASQAWWILHSWDGFPSQTEDGSIDEAVLVEWVKTARRLFADSDRADIGDQLIGKTFAHAPDGSDGIWPAEPVRDLVELIGSEHLETGMVNGKFESRGVTTRDAFDGGSQERELAAQFNAGNEALRTNYPRTARVLKTLADIYEADARREDVRAELDADAD
jgi:hypothetical protein